MYDDAGRGHVVGIDENEHLSLNLARALKLPAAHASVRDFGGERAIVVERLDRATVEGRTIRVHQEDLCQALGVMPEGKYESEGGPGIPQMVGILRETSSDADFDVSTLLDAVFFNWVIGGTDGHGKNYALLLAPHGQVRLAPLYDVISALPYFHPREVRMAVRVGGHYDMWSLRREHWLDLAGELGLDPEDVVERCLGTAREVLEKLSPVCQEAIESGLTAEFVARFEASVGAQAERCVGRLSG